VIDKAVRMRALQGRYGVDHSEILNFEFEQANKPRFDHLNLLVYKDASKLIAEQDKENRGQSLQKSVSNALFERLTQKELAEVKREDNLLPLPDEKAISYNEWLRRKDAERRMRTRLLAAAKNEVR
jgi:hypothetical protein